MDLDHGDEMSHPSVTVAFPCWRRGLLLEKTLASIVRQKYPGHLDFVVVEEEDDGYTRNVARAFGAKYISRERKEQFPLFQSITSLWNQCIDWSTGEIVILQCAEILHESPTVIEDLVRVVTSGEKIMAHAYLKDLNQDGSFNNWYNHPTDGSRPGWVSGSGPHAFNHRELMDVGGYEEMFYGYGHEDDYFFYLLRKNGWKLEYVNTICAHQWHERFKFEPITGYANRSLIHILTEEVENGTRPARANAQPLKVDLRVSHQDVQAVAAEAFLYLGETFKRWYLDCWLFTNDPDITFVAQRTIANEGQGKISELGEAVTEAAWAIKREEEARMASCMNKGYDNWARRAARCADIHATWAARSLDHAGKLLEEIRK